MTRYKQHKIPITVYKKRKTVLNHREIHSIPHTFILSPLQKDPSRRHEPRGRPRRPRDERRHGRHS